MFIFIDVCIYYVYIIYYFIFIKLFIVSNMIRWGYVCYRFKKLSNFFRI